MNQPLSFSHQALAAIRQLKQENLALKRVLNDPIAIVSMAFRFPGGATDEQSFWSLLVDERDALSAIPGDRWSLDDFFDEDPSLPGKVYAKRGGFLENLKAFDPSIFSMTDDEVMALDPQQRHLIELCWEALESANMAPDPNPQSNGPKTGVFVGLASSGFSRFSMLSGDSARIDKHSIPGFAPSFASGRLAYLFGFEGPAMTFDTACSSSLVALHSACQSLRAGDCDAALVGGANALVSPEEYVYFCNAAALSPSSRSRPFNAESDGYVRSEGAAVLVLKRLSDAQRDGDKIEVVIHGSAVNHDGRSNGLTAPNGESQRSLLTRAYEVAGIDPKLLGYIEAHGTGTLLGDPIEVSALGDFLKRAGRSADAPLLIGSVKSNLGHLEAAAGLAGMVKTILALQHGWLPASLHCGSLNRHIAWDELPVKVANSAQEWPVLDKTRPQERFAGVSSFGFSGTNAHVVLGTAPLENAPKSSALPNEITLSAIPFVVSAMGTRALAELLNRMADLCAGLDDADLPTVAYSLAKGRAALARAVIVYAESCADLCERFRSLAKSLSDADARLVSSEEAAAARMIAAALPAQFICLPTYPFQHRNFWPEKTCAPVKSEHVVASDVVAAKNSMPQFDDQKDTVLLFLQKMVSHLTGIELHHVAEAPGLAALALDSITLVKLHFVLQSSLDGEVPLAVLSGETSWDDLDVHLSKLSPATGLDEIVPSDRPLGHSGKLAMTALQEAYWVGRNKARGGNACGSYFYIEFEAGPVLHGDLQDAWNSLIERHSMLRASIDNHELVVPSSRPTFKIARQTTVNKDDAQTKILEMRDRLAHQTFRDGQWPLFQIETLEYGGKQRVFFGIDELIVDGASIVQLLREWQSLVLDHTALTSVDYDFAQYRAFLAKRENEHAGDLTYWEEKCCDLPNGPKLACAEVGIPTERKRLKAVLGPSVLFGLEKQAKVQKVSLTALVLKIFAKTLSDVLEQDDLTLILTYFNRLPIHPNVDKIVGPIAATTLFRWNANMDAAQVRDHLLADAEHSSVDGVTLLRRLRRKGIIENSFSLPVVFTSMIENFDTGDYRTTDGYSWSRNWSYAISQTPDVLLDHQIGRRADHLVLSWDVAAGLLDLAKVEALFDVYGAALTAVSEGAAALPYVKPAPVVSLSAATAVQKSYAYGYLASGQNCQVYQEIRADRFAHEIVEQAWQAVLAKHGALQMRLDPTGTFRPKIEGASWSLMPAETFADEDARSLCALRNSLKASNRDPATWPPFALRLSHLETGQDIVHVAIDMIVADWPSIQQIYFDFCKALNGDTLATEPSALPRKALETSVVADRGYWTEKLARIAPAKLELAHNGRRTTRRLTQRINNWRAFSDHANLLGISPEDALAACFSRSAAGLTQTGRVPVVLVDFGRPEETGDQVLVGDCTRLAWADLQPDDATIEQLAKTIETQRVDDWAADPDLGLSLMGRFGPYKADKSGFALPFVFSRLLQFKQVDPPAGLSFGQGVSSTPGVALDDVSVLMGDDLMVNWDVDLSVFGASLVESCFETHCSNLNRACQGSSFWTRGDKHERD